MNPYDVLEINQDATPEEIKEAYRKLAQVWHPDKHPDNQAEATSRFQQIDEAYRFLSDGAQRMRFDDLGEQFEDELQVAAVHLLIHFEEQLLGQPDHLDHAKAIQTLLNNSIVTNRARISEVRMKIRSAQELAKRWKKTKGRNLFANMYLRRVRQMEGLIKDMEEAIVVSEAAGKILKEYSFEVNDVRPAAATLYIRYMGTYPNGPSGT